MLSFLLLTYWQLFSVKSLFLKGMLLWAKLWIINWHSLQNSYPEETAKAVQCYAVLQAVRLLHPAPTTALTVRFRNGEETQPRCKDGKINWSKKCFTCQWCGPGLERKKCTSGLLISSYYLSLDIAVFTSDKIWCLPPFLLSDREDTWCCCTQPIHLTPELLSLWTGLTL